MLKVKRSFIIEQLNALHSDSDEPVTFDNASNDVLEEEYCLTGLFANNHGHDDEEWDENDLVIVD